MKFFHTRSSQCGAGVFCTAMLLGGGISAYISMLLFEQCLDTIEHIEQIIGRAVTIPSLSVVTDLHGYSIPISLKDVTVELPPNIIKITLSADALPHYYYKASMTVLMILTISIALSLSACASSNQCVTSGDNVNEYDSTKAPLLASMV